MKKQAPIPQNEAMRLAALQSFQIKYSLPEEQYDRLTKLASAICGTPIAYISFIEKDTQWFKSSIGVKAPQMPREFSICQYTVMGQDTLEIEDALQDEQFKNNPLVTGPPYFRFYAGQPLAEGEISYGTLCVISDKPKKLSETQKIALKILAQEVVSQMHLRKKEIEVENLEKLFSMSIDMICIAGTDGYFKKVNPALTHTLGFSEEELLKMPFTELLHPDDIESSLKEIEKLSTGIKTIGFENRFRNKAGHYKLFSWVANPDASTGELFSIGRDITEKRATEQELFKVQERHLTFFNNSQGIMSTHDMQGNLLHVNPAGSKMLGYTKEELEKMNLVDVLSSETKENVKPYLKLIKENGSAEGLMTVMSKQGVIKTWKYNNILIADGDDEYVIGNALDITDLINIEKEVNKAKDLAEQNAVAKDIFLANMSHEIRTPMNAIMGFSELLAATKLNKDQRESIDAVQMAGENLLIIINDILDFSKIESGGLVLEQIPISLREITTNVKKLLANKATEKKIEFNLYVEDEIPEYVLGDKVRLIQILINTIGNAIKFTEKGKVDVFCNILSKDKTTCLVEIRIKDTGIGIPADKQSIIFERFKQAENNTTVEDNELNQKLAKKVLEQNHIKAAIVSNGQEAITILKKQSFDLIMMDLQMPVMDGYVATECIRKKLKLKTPIIALTAHSLVGEKAKCIDSGMNDYLSKPFKAAELVEKIHKLVNDKSNTSLIKTTLKTSRDSIKNISEDINAHYNISHLEELSDGDKSFITESVNLFIRTVQQDMQSMKEAFLNNDLESVRKVAHKLKTSYSMFKADKGFDICNTLEYGSNMGMIREKIDLLHQYSMLLIADMKKNYNIIN